MHTSNYPRDPQPPAAEVLAKLPENQDLLAQPEEIRGPILEAIAAARASLTVLDSTGSAARSKMGETLPDGTFRGVYYEDLVVFSPQYRVVYRVPATETRTGLYVQAEFDQSGDKLVSAGKVTSDRLPGRATLAHPEQQAAKYEQQAAK